MINISIIGSTGSIGTQALSVIESFPDKFRVVALSAYSNWEKLLEQILRFKPCAAAIIEERAFRSLKDNLPPSSPTKLYSSEEGVSYISSMDEADLVLVSSVGISGLKPVVSAIKAGKQLALATKEALVSGGSLVMSLAKRYGIVIRPVDSEHSAVFQCIGSDREFLNKIILTCSGGSLRDFSLERMKSVSVSQVLRHPTWAMGKKITVDSATLMNKGFEVIEACHLFGLPADKVDVLIHPQSIIHSMVEFSDGAIIAQLSKPDMRLAIQYALSYPDRLSKKWSDTDFLSVSTLSFEKPDLARFPCLGLAYAAFAAGGASPAVLNASNEEAVKAFLEGRIRFCDIYAVTADVISKIEVIEADSLENIYYADSQARLKALELIRRLEKTL